MQRQAPRDFISARSSPRSRKCRPLRAKPLPIFTKPELQAKRADRLAGTDEVEAQLDALGGFEPARSSSRERVCMYVYRAL